MFLFFSVISLPYNFCQMQPASELDSPSTTELTMRIYFRSSALTFSKLRASFEKVSAKERKYIRIVSSVVEGESSSDAGCIWQKLQGKEMK